MITGVVADLGDAPEIADPYFQIWPNSSPLRATRAEYWYFVLFHVLAVVALGIVDNVVGSFNEEAEIGLLSGLFVLATFIPSLAVTVRRLHDADRSGWWVLINLVPIIGALVLLLFTVLDSQPGANRFGPNPKG